MALNSLNDLYIEQLRDLYSAELQIGDALPKMAARAQHPELRQAFETHLRQSQEHARRIEVVCDALGVSPKGETSKGMKGLIDGGEELVRQRGDPNVCDAALIAGAQRVEHYEIAGYGCVKTYARLLGRDEEMRLLQQTENEEGETDKLLTALAERVINVDALRANRDVTAGARGASSTAGQSASRTSTREPSDLDAT